MRRAACARLGAAGAPPGVDEVLAAAGALLREAPRC
jgi:hypothetical protein